MSLIWLIPIIAGGIAIWLGYNAILTRGPLVTLTFNSGDGLTAGQTQVKHKAVALGTVEDVRLSKDLQHVVVQVRMHRAAEPILTDHARFWVVRPRLTPGDISGLETLVSGAYIEVDPGTPGGKRQLSFTGLETPPAVRSDEPGHSFVLKAQRLGSLGPGSPVFYRDVKVGEVLSFDLGNGLGPVSLNVFVRSPYDKFVHPDTRFWDASGVSVGVGPEGLHVELQSILALLSGGISFETARDVALHEPPVGTGAEFQLYKDKSEADAANYHQQIAVAAYFRATVRGLAAGSAVQIFGVQIGTVSSVRLILDPAHGEARIRVGMMLQPERVLGLDHDLPDPPAMLAAFVQKGMRAVIENSNFVTGQEVMSLEYVPNAGPGIIGHEGDTLILPSQPGGLDNVMTSVSDIATKLDRIPFDRIGANLNATLRSVNATVSGPDVKNALRNLSATLADVRQLVQRVDRGMTPVLQRLPAISDQLQQAVERANSAFGSGGYGQNSDFQSNLERMMDQVNDTARSVRLLADFLQRHPNALIFGRGGRATER